MSPPLGQVRLSIRVGDFERTIPLVALATSLRVSPQVLRSALAWWLPSEPSDHEAGEPTEGVRSERTDTFSPKNTSETLRSDRPARDDATELASMLVRALDDESSRAGLEKLCREQPRALLLEALQRTSKIPPERVRRSRGALFTAIVRKLVLSDWQPHSSSSSPYAGTPSAAA